MNRKKRGSERVLVRAALTDFPPGDPFTGAPSRGPFSEMHSRGHGWQHRYASAEVAAFTGVKAHCLSRVTGERDGGETRRTAGICVLTGSKQSGRSNRARGRACVRRKNDEDGRRVARPPAQGRRRSQLRAEQHAGASLFRDTRDRARFGNCYESFLRDSANARFAKGGETEDGSRTRFKNDPRKPHQWPYQVSVKIVEVLIKFEIGRRSWN